MLKPAYIEKARKKIDDRLQEKKEPISAKDMKELLHVAAITLSTWRKRNILSSPPRAQFTQKDVWDAFDYMTKKFPSRVIEIAMK